MERGVGRSIASPGDDTRRWRRRLAVLVAVLSVLSSVVAFQPGLAVADRRVDPVDLPGEGTSVDPYRIADVSGLQAMRDDPDAHYVLVADVDASGTSAWDGGSGFEPIGNGSDPFNGSLDGDGHRIAGLTIDRPATGGVGLFGVLGNTGTVTGVGLEDVAVGGGDVVGGLVRENRGTVVDSSATGTVIGGELVGGLVGVNEGTVTGTAANGSVSGTYTVGGLVGLNEGGTVRSSDATGAVDGEFHVGGLVGFTRSGGTVVDSSSNGTVTGSGCVGGVVGTLMDGSVTDSVAGGAVTGDEQVGGLVGTVIALDSSRVERSSASGTVTGRAQVGGLVGVNVAFDTVEVKQSSASGTVTGVDRVGGLVGQNFATGVGTLAVNGSGATGTVRGHTDVGGLVGENVVDDPTGMPANVTVERSSVTGTVSGVYRVGGLVGRNVASTVARSSASGAVTGERRVGGLVGSNGEAGTVERSRATGRVTGDDDIGGLVGWNFASTVASSYAIGRVDASGSVGALVGTNERGGTVSQSYATGELTGGTPGSGLVGTAIEPSTVVDSYWDTDATGVDRDPSVDWVGTGLATAEMTGANAVDTMRGFDVPGTWHLTAGYPALAWEDVGPFFAVNVTSTTGPVDEGDAVWVNATVTNYGGPGREAVSLRDTGFDDAVRDRVDVELDTGETESVGLSWTTGNGDGGMGPLTVASDDDADSVVVTVRSAGSAVDAPTVAIAAAVLLVLLAAGLVVTLGRRPWLR
jgi:hypothetical protein